MYIHIYIYRYPHNAPDPYTLRSVPGKDEELTKDNYPFEQRWKPFQINWYNRRITNYDIGTFHWIVEIKKKGEFCSELYWIIKPRSNVLDVLIMKIYSTDIYVHIYIYIYNNGEYNYRTDQYDSSPPPNITLCVSKTIQHFEKRKICSIPMQPSWVYLSQKKKIHQ